MFASIARRYDLANHVLSCGSDFYWRKRAAEIVAGWRPNKVFDLATGTGDLALAIQRILPNVEVIGADFSEEMLAVARGKGVREVTIADALALPFADGAFDCVTIAFGANRLPAASLSLRFSAFDQARTTAAGERVEPAGAASARNAKRTISLRISEE